MKFGPYYKTIITLLSTFPKPNTNNYTQNYKQLYTNTYHFKNLINKNLQISTLKIYKFYYFLKKFKSYTSILSSNTVRTNDSSTIKKNL